VLVELGVVEQRHAAVLEVLGGLTVLAVARRYGVSRQTAHRWLRLYARAGIVGLADRSSRPATCPHRMAPVIEAKVVELRRAHPGWGPRTLRHRLGVEGVTPRPTQVLPDAGLMLVEIGRPSARVLRGVVCLPGRGTPRPEKRQPEGEHGRKADRSVANKGPMSTRPATRRGASAAVQAAAPAPIELPTMTAGPPRWPASAMRSVPAATSS
jgi:transposase